MPAVKTKRISTLIETQLPEFISTEYELFSKFVQKYYEAQEVQGGTLDIINNIQKYADIDFYEKEILTQHDTLATTVTDSDTTIVVADARSFPKKNGYIRIDDEIIFYATRTDTELQECSRGVSGNTSLGDLYEASNFASTDAAAHVAGQKVYNVSNLFLYALVKNFENQYLGSFPEKYLKGEVDKRTLIKNIQKFYKAKGTKSSIQFIFNTIVSKEANNKPEVYKPRDFTYKSSDSDWVSVFALKCKLVSGDPKNLIGKKIVQAATEEYGYADATVDNVKPAGTADGEAIYDIILAPETVNGEFFVSTKTELTQPLSGVASNGDRINAFSTLGWEKTGSVLIGTETITFSEKTATQFIIDERNPNNAIPHASGEFIYKPVTIAGSGVTLLTFGVVYNLQPSDSHPYSYPGDVVEISNPGFETDDPKITQVGSNQTRWILNTGTAPNVPTLPSVATSISQVATDVSAIFADDQYYYITSSSFPSHKILDGSTVNETVLDQKLLRIVRKVATRTTETYATPRRDVGIGLNGVLLYGYKDHSSIRFGKLEEIKVDLRGTGYRKPPFVLIDQVPNKARAVLNGQVVESIIVDTDDIFPKTPDILITSGRNADIRAVVTGGKVTSLVIENPGEFYSAPPLIQIRDRAGRGRFAEFEAIVNTDGNITGFNKIAEGNFYNQDTVIVDVIPIGSGASGIPLLKEWNFNRFKKLENELDTENGYIFQNYNNALEYGYGYVGNPLALRSALNDNLTGTNQETSTIVHSPIIGFAHDGNPIYGPYGYQNPLDSTSTTIRMTSGYSLNSARSNGPSITQYPLGTFNNDYTYTHKSGTLDQNNGRFCVTPEFPKGTYAYFLTIDSNQVPQFPYILGENFYSLPVDSNYNSNISQDDIPKNSKRFFQPGMPRNGEGVIAKIEEVKPGNVEKVNVVSSSDNFSINSQIYFDNRGTDGSDAEAIISSVKGKSVNYLESKENKVVKLTVVQSAYLFANDTLNQPSSSASGTIVGTVRNDNTIVLRNVNGTFDQTGTFSASIKTFTVLLDQRSSYTKGATLSLTDGVNAPIATAEVLEGTASQNTVQIKVLSGTWIVDNDYFIQSDDLFNTSGTRLVRLTSLSDGLEPFEVNQSVALVETATNHGLGIGDQVTIDINPDDTSKTKTYYLRKRLYQEATLIPPSKKTTINFTGIGRYEILNGGADYTAGTYTSVALTGGSGTGATATFTVSNAGVVSGVQLQNAGSGYARGDYLTVADESLVRSSASQSTARFTIYIGHVGFAAGATQVTVDDALGFANNDLIKIGAEVLRINSISGSNLNVTRAQEETADVDHFDGQEVSLYKARYNFDTNYAIFNTATTGYVQTYDPVTQKIKIVYDYGTLTTNASTVELSSSFFDNSTPRRLVAVKSSESVKYKFEFSEDNTTFTPNPNINLQEFYKYIFDTSHSSLTGTYFDISPSRNYNLITVEKQESTILPGNPGAFTDVKFGFGSRLADNNYQTKRGTDFANFYYFDKKNVVDSEGAFFKIVTDPLQGRKTINYVTADRFVYDIPSEPLWDGSGSISYTTTGQFAIGGINDVSIINLGLNYRKPPVVVGVDPTESYRASATVLFDDASQTITGVNISNIGSNYVNPKVVVTKGDGSGVEFNIVVRNGEIFSITIANPGRGYTYAPEIIIVESEVKAFVESSSIGVPQSIKITDNGGAFHLDNTVSSTFSSNYTVSLTGNSYNFKVGEIVTQTLGGQEVCRAKVSEFRKGTNLLKIREVRGIIRQNVPIVGAVTKSGGTVKTIFVTTLNEKVTSFYDNLGYYTSDKGRLGVSNQKLTDSYFYQDYSYVVKSKTPIDQWRELIKSTTHPAGFQLFGQVDVESSASTEMPVEVPKASHFSVIQLWDPDKNKITVESTKQVTTQSIQSVQNQRIRKAQGTAATSEFNFNEVRAFEFTLAAPFDGYYDTDGRLQGTTSFQILNDLGVPFFPASEKGLIVTLDGVLQEPGVSYNIAGDRIVFSAPPLGPGTKLTGDGGGVTSYKGVTFYGKVFQFKDAQYNTRYLRKIRNIFQRGGTWIDSANQIERNVGFIVNETIGYAKAIYPTLDWSTKQDDYEANIRSILDAYQHDLRFGGNVKTINYTSVFNTNSDYLYIQNNRTESTGIFAYASRLAKLAIRNWDYIDIGISYVQGSRQMTVTSTENIAVGMFVSSGRAYPSGTKIVSIDSDTQITLNNAALANSGGGGGAPVGVTPVTGTAGSGSSTSPTNTAAVAPGNTFAVPPGSTFIVPTSFSGTDQAKFSWSALNNGMFYKAGELIDLNKDDIVSKSLTWSETNYPSAAWGSLPNKEDIGNLIDAYVYHLKLGGNFKLVERAQLYWRQNDYPYGEQSFYDSGRGRQDMWIKAGASRASSYGSNITDTHYYTVGMIQPTNTNSRSNYVAKWNFDGTVVWQKEMNGSSYESLTEVSIDKQGNVYVAGNTRSEGIGGRDIYIAKFTADGNLVWQKTYGASTDASQGNQERVFVIRFDSNDNLLLATTYGQFSAPSYAIMLIDPDGDIVWEKGLDKLIRPQIMESDDSFYGFLYEDDTSNIVYCDSDANIIWQKRFTSGFSINGLHRKSNGNYIIVGNEVRDQVNGRNQIGILVIETDSNFNIINQKTFTETSLGYVAASRSTIDSEGNVYTAGTMYDSVVGVDSYTPVSVKFNSDLNVEWIRTLDGGNNSTEIWYGINIAPNDKHIYLTGFARPNASNIFRHVHAKLLVDGSGIGVYGGLTYASKDYTDVRTTSYTLTPFTPSVVQSSISYTVLNSNFTVTDSGYVVDTLLDSNASPSYSGNFDVAGTVATFAYAKDLMISAMKNQGEFTDPNVLVDSVSPACAEVESSLNTYHSIVDTIITEGRGLVEKTPRNSNKAGNWTSDLTYSNYNILGDPLLPAQECNNVISAVDSLYDNLADVLQRETVTKSLPDYIDGETKEFELYWDDNTVVNTEEDEDLFLTLNAVLQRPKFTDGYPLEDSYVIDRTVIPNKIKFDVAPIWDQDLGAKTIGEPSCVEKVAGIGVGNYKRLTIDYDLVNGVRNGPFLILDVLDYTVQNIEAEDNLYVFLDGVLQRKGYSYTISGPNITFNVPIKKEMKIDMRYLYGRDVGQILNIYDFAPDSYFARGTFTFDTTVADDLLRYDWMGDAIGSPIHVWQQRANGTYNVLGEMTAAIRNGNTVSFSLKGQNAEIESGLDFTFVPRGYYTRTFIIADADISNASLAYNTDDVGRKLLLDDNGLWSGTAYGKTYKPPFVSLSNNDQIRVEGEEGFRRVKKLPTISTSKDGRPGEQLSDDIFGAVSIETYTGVTRGEGLSVVATVENGSVVSLSWNQRSYDPITQPTAYQYYTPPVLKFIPENGQGGGARANVLVSKGQVISVDLIDGGSGYTEAPKVITTRRFDVLSERGIGVSLINVGVNPFVQTGGMLATSVISEIEESGLSGLTSIASVTFGELNEATINIERDFDLKEVEVFSTGGALDPQRDYVEIAYNNNPSADSVIAGTLDYEATVVSAEIQDIVSLNSISTVSRAITQTQQIEIPNNAISNINFFETAAYLDLDFNIGDSIAYIPDTTKFDPQGLLLIGDEIVYYNRKLSDRFVNILRNRKGTTEQNWVAGTYLRQIPELVSVASAGVVTIESESDVSMASGGATSIAFERNTQREISSPADFSITREAFEVVVTPPPGGVVDRYQESAFINDPLLQRNGNEVDLIDINGEFFVALRSAAPDIAIRNATAGELDYIGSYEVTNVGHTLSHYNNIFDDGANSVSGITIQEFNFYFADITLDDFVERADSSFAKSGTRFNLMPPSIQNPVTISASTGGLSGTINAQSTAGFPSTGYAFTSNGSVFQYTGKTSTSFTGVTLTRGPNSINTTHEIIPFTIS